LPRSYAWAGGTGRISATPYQTLDPFGLRQNLHANRLYFPQGTKDVRIDPLLNKEVWKQGIKGTPYRIRIRISRRRNDEEGAKEKLYSYVQAVATPNGARGLQTQVIEDA
jgi:hypothetical protein